MIFIEKIKASVPSEIGFEGIYSIISRWKNPNITTYQILSPKDHTLTLIEFIYSSLLRVKFYQTY